MVSSLSSSSVITAAHQALSQVNFCCSVFETALAEWECYKRSTLVWAHHMKSSPGCLSSPALMASWRVKYCGHLWKLPAGPGCKKVSCLEDLHQSCHIPACAIIQILGLPSCSGLAWQNVIWGQQELKAQRSFCEWLSALPAAGADQSLFPALSSPSTLSQPAHHPGSL